jgi:hypothetical protein
MGLVEIRFDETGLYGGANGRQQQRCHEKNRLIDLFSPEAEMNDEDDCVCQAEDAE